MSDQQFSSVSALRVYMKRGDNKKAARWWNRIFERPLAHHIVTAALQAGLMHAAVNLGHMGFGKDAKSVAYDSGEVPLSTLPVCVELLGPKRQLEQFIRDQARHLKGTTLVMLDGVHISNFYVDMDNAISQHPHRVEYIEGTLAIEHVEMDEPEPEAEGA